MSWMRPPVAAGPIERKCKESNGFCATAAMGRHAPAMTERTNLTSQAPVGCCDELNLPFPVAFVIQSESDGASVPHCLLRMLRDDKKSIEPLLLHTLPRE